MILKYKQTFDGDWVKPEMNNYKISCCDCGLVHTVNIRIVEDKVEYQVFRDNRATSAKRRNKKKYNIKLKSKVK
jgi:hypothetical protein